MESNRRVTGLNLHNQAHQSDGLYAASLSVMFLNKNRRVIMDLSDRPDSYLMKTYCHLVKNVIPLNDKNMNDFPPAWMWQGVRDEIEKAKVLVSEELSKRNIDASNLDCSIYDFR